MAPISRLREPVWASVRIAQVGRPRESGAFGTGSWTDTSTKLGAAEQLRLLLEHREISGLRNLGRCTTPEAAPFG